MDKKYKNHILQIQFVDSATFIASSLSSVSNNPTEGDHKIEF